jgi:hypothetical protein
MRGRRASSLIDEGRGNGEFNCLDRMVPNVHTCVLSSAR